MYDPAHDSLSLFVDSLGLDSEERSRWDAMTNAPDHPLSAAELERMANELECARGT